MSKKFSTDSLTNSTSDKNKQTKKVAILFELIQFISPYKGHVIAAFIALIFTAAVMLSVGQAVRMLIDEGFAQQSIQQLQYAVLFILTITVLIAGGTFSRFYLVSWLGERVSADIRLAVSSPCTPVILKPMAVAILCRALQPIQPYYKVSSALHFLWPFVVY
jgi:ATP-binding cassette subfamily B protein